MEWPFYPKAWTGLAAPVAAICLRGSKKGFSTTLAVVSPECARTSNSVPSSADSTATMAKAMFLSSRGE